MKLDTLSHFNATFGLQFRKASDVRDFLMGLFSFNAEAKRDLIPHGRSNEFWEGVEKWVCIWENEHPRTKEVQLAELIPEPTATDHSITVNTDQPIEDITLDLLLEARENQYFVILTAASGHAKLRAQCAYNAIELAIETMRLL